MFTNSSVAIVMAFGIILGSGSAEISREEISSMGKKNVTVASTMANSKNTDEVEGVCYASEIIDVEAIPDSISAQAACKIALKYTDRAFEARMVEIYNKIYTAAVDGHFTIRIYSDELSKECVSSDIQKIIKTLENRGYDVSVASSPTELDEWVLMIDWNDCYKEDN